MRFSTLPVVCALGRALFDINQKENRGGNKCLSDHETLVENDFQHLQYNGVFPVKTLLGIYRTSKHIQSVPGAVV